jgi:4-amino-4-deoxy-L-arabinose transferase-like glycosyltransferase
LTRKYDGRRVLLAVLLAAAICPYFIDLGGSAIWDANEAFYVETPREMIERADYISPSFNYEPRFNKPVLSYWIVAAFYRLFGISVAVQRVPIAIGGIVLVAVAFFLARVAESRSAGSRRIEAPIWAALGLAVSPRLLMFARRIFIDVYISMFMGLTLLFFAAAERYESRRRFFLILMYVSVGLGMLTKGPVAVVLPALVFILYLAVHGELRRLREIRLPEGLAIVLAIVVPWYAELYRRYGWTYITSFFVGENLERFTEGTGVLVSRGPWFYLPVVIGDSFPWSIFLLPAAAIWFLDRRRNQTVPDPGFRIRTLMWLWVFVIVGFFSLSAAKQDLYIFPIVPAVAALAGCAIARAIDSTGHEIAVKPSVRATAAIAGFVLAIVGAGLLILLQAVGSIYVLQGILTTAFIALIGGLVILLLAVRRWIAGAAIAVCVTMIVFNWIFVLRTLPSFEAYKPVPAFADLLRDRAQPDDEVATYNTAMPSLVYYLKRQVAVVFDERIAAALLESGRGTYIVMPSEDYDRVRALSPGSCVIDRRPTFDVKLRNIISRDPLPDLVIVTNRCRR